MYCILLVHLQVAASQLFERKGADLHSTVEISLAQAALGGTIKAPGLYEQVELEVSLRSNDIMQLFALLEPDCCRLKNFG